jgi:hypothetical protein
MHLIAHILKSFYCCCRPLLAPGQQRFRIAGRSVLALRFKIFGRARHVEMTMVLNIVLHHSMMMPVFGDLVSILEKEITTLRQKIIELDQPEVAQQWKRDPLSFDPSLTTTMSEY